MDTNSLRVKQIRQKDSNNNFISYPIGVEGNFVDLLSNLNLEEELKIGGNHYVEIEDGQDYLIIKEYYSGEMPLFHMDVYRLDGVIDGVGIEDYFKKNGVCIIEWADTIRDYLPEERLDIKIKVVGEDTRLLIFKPHGVQYEELCEAIL